MRTILLVAICTLTLVSSASAERFGHLARAATVKTASLRCTTTRTVASQAQILYKDSNVHGGRGRTFLDQAHQFGGSRRLSIAGTNKKIIGCFGLWACDRPFGCRYYQAMCGDGQSKSQLATKARANGGTNTVLVGNGSGKCFSFNALSSREGRVNK